MARGVPRHRGKPPRVDERSPAKLTAEALFWRRIDGGIEVRVKVVPAASRSEIAGILGDRLKVRVAAPPEAGKANRALIDLLTTWLGVREVEIVAGRSASEKTVRVRGLSSVPGWKNGG